MRIVVAASIVINNILMESALHMRLQLAHSELDVRAICEVCGRPPTTRARAAGLAKGHVWTDNHVSCIDSRSQYCYNRYQLNKQ